MKKFFILLLVFTTAVLILNGCSISQNSEEPTEVDEYGNTIYVGEDSIYNDNNGESVDSFVPDYREGYENSNGNTHANLYNEGIAAEQDGWIYHFVRIGNSNGKGSTSTIYKHKSDSATDINVITIDAYIKRLSVKGDYIYFLYGGNELYRVRTDGSMMEDVFVNEDNIYEKDYMIVGDYIYVTKETKYSSVSSSDSVVRYNINDTSTCETIYKLNEGDTYYGVTGNYVVTKQESKSRVEDVLWIYNMETDEIEKHTCASGIFCYNVQLGENTVYYTNNYYNGVVKVDLTDMQVSVAENESLEIAAINFVDENTIYLRIGNWMSDTNILAKMSFSLIQGGQYYEILEESPSSICIAGDWIYYTAGSYGMESYCRVKTDGTGWEMLYEH